MRRAKFLFPWATFPLHLLTTDFCESFATEDFSILAHVLVRVSFVINHHDPKQSGVKRIYFILQFQNTVYHRRKSRQKYGGRNWSKSHERKVLTNLFLVACKSAISYYTGLPAQGDNTLNGLGPHLCMNNQENALQTCLWAIWWGHFLI